MSEIVILSAVRLPSGGFLGSLKGFTAPQFGAMVVREAVAHAGPRVGGGNGVALAIERSDA